MSKACMIRIHLIVRYCTHLDAFTTYLLPVENTLSSDQGNGRGGDPTPEAYGSSDGMTLQF